MGKGDRRSKRGKINVGSNGVTRPKGRKNRGVSEDSKKTSSK